MPHYELKRIYTFEAAHSLPHLGKDHKCAKLHGHNYKVELCVAGDTNPHSGMVMDFAEVDKVWDACCKPHLDHANLDDVEGLEKPTAEWIALWIKNAMRAGELSASPVTVWENERSAARVF